MPPDQHNDNRLCTASSRDEVKCFIANKLVLTVVVLGASGDLANKKTFPALFTLFKKGCVGLGVRLLKMCLFAHDLAASSSGVAINC